MAIIDAVDITTGYLSIKFTRAPKITSLTNDRFEVVSDTSSPSLVASPFQDIDLANYYNSISKTLTLYWNTGVLEPSTSYTVTVTGLRDAAGILQDNESFTFSTDSSITVAEDDLPPTAPVIEVEDHTIIDGAYTDFVINPANLDFKFSESDPVTGDYYLPPDFNLGRIAVTFTMAPTAASVTTANFRVQKKPISRNHSRWEDVPVRLTQSAETVWIDLPSADHYPEAATPQATPVYYEDDYEYYSENYKYRLILSKNILTEMATPSDTLVSDVTLTWAGVIDPLYVSPDELLDIFPDASELEIAEAVYIYSVEAEEALSLGQHATPSFAEREYIKAAAACLLSRTYDAISGDELTFRLGDFSVTNRNVPKTQVTRANAVTWCEIAGVLRVELMSTKTRMRAVVRGADYPNPIPARKLRYHNRDERSITQLDNPIYQGNLDTWGS